MSDDLLTVVAERLLAVGLGVDHRGDLGLVLRRSDIRERFVRVEDGALIFENWSLSIIQEFPIGDPDALDKFEAAVREWMVTSDVRPDGHHRGPGGAVQGHGD